MPSAVWDTKTSIIAGVKSLSLAQSIINGIQRCIYFVKLLFFFHFFIELNNPLCFTKKLLVLKVYINCEFVCNACFKSFMLQCKIVVTNYVTELGSNQNACLCVEVLKCVVCCRMLRWTGLFGGILLLLLSRLQSSHFHFNHVNDRI